MTRRQRSMDDWAEARERLMADPAFAAAFNARYPYANVADAILDLRAAQGLTQKELAEAAGTTQSVIARLESGRHPVGTKFLSALADGLGMDWRPVFEAGRVAVEDVEEIESDDERDNVVSLFGTRPSPPSVSWSSDAVTIREAPEAEVAEALDAIQSRIEQVRELFEAAPHHGSHMSRRRADVG